MKDTLLIRLDRAIGATLRLFTIACLVSLTVLLAINIIGRATGWFGIAWFDEVVTTLFAWMVFIGASALWRECDHFTITLLPDYLAGKSGQRLHRLIVALVGLLFAGVLLVYGARFVARTAATTPVLELPQAWAYACLPIAGLLMTLYALRDVWLAIRATSPKPAPTVTETRLQ
ncbi:TRAP transporter small permease [Bordetella tumulicola]|uniref:TRAP transporter small permease n=1 Tax=Bordetella tumulicola TaxID=1649133 RepID=UPI0039EFD0EC